MKLSLNPAAATVVDLLLIALACSAQEPATTVVTATKAPAGPTPVLTEQPALTPTATTDATPAAVQV